MIEKYQKIFQEVNNEHVQNIDKHRNSRVLIIDGLNTFIRCWSSIPTMNEDGDHVAGVTNVLLSIGYAIKQTNPTRVIVVFDGKDGSSGRKKIYSGYKSKRGKNKMRVNRSYADMMNVEDERESMKRQFMWLTEFLHNLPVTTMIYDRVEADDVMAYVAGHLLKENEQGVLMSTDKDFLQLVDDTTIVWSPTKKKIYNINSVYEDFGIKPHNLLLYRVLDGDVSDEIPGIRGCGLKTVHKRFPELTGDKKLTVEDLLRLANEKSGKVKLYDDIRLAKEQIRMNRRLMQLDDPEISGNVKTKIMSKFDEDTTALNKLDFMKVCLKYKVTDKFTKDIHGWLGQTFGMLVTS